MKNAAQQNNRRARRGLRRLEMISQVKFDCKGGSPGFSELVKIPPRGVSKVDTSMLILKECLSHDAESLTMD